MKKILSIIFVLLVAIVVAIFLSKSAPVDEVTYKLESEGLAFTYKSGPQGYYLEEQNITQSDSPQLVRSITITPTSDYEDQKNRVGGEGSPSFQLMVYGNELKQSQSIWVDANPLASNIKLVIGETREEVVAGANAVAYTIDGLYRTDVVVIANGGFIFVASSSYLDDKSMTYLDFSSWLKSFKFIPTDSTISPQGKIDINVACRSALAYTTFVSGEEAEKFVKDCIDGKHPDVIERYIQSLGINGATI